MAGRKSAFRGRLFKGLHAEAAKRGMSHDDLRALCHDAYGIHSLSEMTEIDLMKLYKGWTGRGLRRKCMLPGRGEAAKTKPGEIRMASADELCELESEFAKRGLGQEGKENFIRRQLGGRLVVRTRAQFCSVLGGLRAMNRRDPIGAKESEEAHA